MSQTLSPFPSDDAEVTVHKAVSRRGAEAGATGPWARTLPALLRPWPSGEGGLLRVAPHFGGHPNFDTKGNQASCSPCAARSQLTIFVLNPC